MIEWLKGKLGVRKLQYEVGCMPSPEEIHAMRERIADLMVRTKVLEEVVRGKQG